MCNGHCREPSNCVDFSNYRGYNSNCLKYQKSLGKWIHSHDYRHATDFSGEVVGIIGTGYSGIDIVLQVAEVAKKVT